MSNLQTYYHFKLDFQKVDQHTGGKWLIHGTKRRKDMMIWIKPMRLATNVQMMAILYHQWRSQREC